MWSIWRVTGRDPYCIWHELDDHFVSIHGGGEPMPPPYPSRLYGVLCAFGAYSVKHEARLQGAKFPGDEERAREQRRQQKG